MGLLVQRRCGEASKPITLTSFLVILCQLLTTGDDGERLVNQGVWLLMICLHSLFLCYYICRYLGTALEDNVVSIFMQYVPGGSIANILARFGALEEEVFCNYTKQILEGVEYLHANNVIHRYNTFFF